MFGYTRDVRLRIYLMAFLLINILLCVMGTFWYRVNRRKEETGIRKAFGAGQPSIRRLFVLEGLALLAIASLPAMLIEGNFAYAGLVDTLGRQEMAPELYLPDRPVLRFFIVNIITWLIMAIVVSIAIWIPARNAAGMHPADVLKHE
jgi:ABC-type antimicrobial peptide transport system permease subunit